MIIGYLDPWGTIGGRMIAENHDDDIRTEPGRVGWVYG